MKYTWDQNYGGHVENTLYHHVPTTNKRKNIIGIKLSLDYKRKL